MENNQEDAPNTITQAKPRLWNLNFLIICLSSLTMYMVFHSLNSTLPVYIKEFGGTTRVAGLALTSLTLAAIIARPLTGWSLDKYGRRLLLTGGLMLFLAPSVTYIKMIPVFLLIALRFVQGLGWGTSHTAVSTVALDVVPPERIGEGLGFFSLFSSLSMALSPAIALWLIAHFSFRELFIACSVLTLCTLAASLFIQYPKVEKLAGGSRFELLEMSALWPSIVIFLVLFAYSSVVSFLALYAIDLGLPTSAAGLYFTAVALTTLISRPLSGIIVDRVGQRGFDLCIIIGILAAFTAVFILVCACKPLHLLLAGLFYGLCSGFLHSIILVLSISIVPVEKKGMANAFYWTAVDLGIASGSLFWGFVAAASGFKLMFGLTAIPLLLAVGVYRINRTKKKQQEQEAEVF